MESLSKSPDVLWLTIPLRGAYASFNALDKMDRRKSPAYLDLFRDTREAARAEMARIGWTTATFRCEVSVIRYCADRGQKDASNVGKAELDALSPSTAQQHVRDRCATFPGVWRNDSLARPYHADIEYDPAGPDRIVIIIRRRFPDAIGTQGRAPGVRASVGKAAQKPSAEAPATVDTLPDGRAATLNGAPFSYAKALALVRKDR